MNDVFRPYLNKFVLAYLDNVLIFSRSESTYALLWSYCANTSFS